MIRRFSISGSALGLLAFLLALPAYAGTEAGTLSGVVRDGKGTPQIGALVELLKPDFSVIARTFTDDRGHYSLPEIAPGVYAVKASGALFLPTLRENLRLLADSKLVVNLTLSTLYEAFRWLPAKPRQADEPQDDWTWTLRLSANRPLLRMLEDGPLVVVTDAEGTNPALKARVTVHGGANVFGQGGVHHDFEMQRSTSDSRQLILRADLSQAENPALNTVVGYEQELAPGRTLRTVAAVQSQPAIAGGPNAQGMQSLILRTAETFELMDAVKAEFGNEFEAVHLGETQIASHPFAGIQIHDGNVEVAYRVATSPGAQRADGIDRRNSLSPAISEQNGRLAIEHGLHQEVSVARTEGNLSMAMTMFHDVVDHPVITGGGTISTADWNGGNLLYDPATEIIKIAGQNYSSNGFLGEIKERLDENTWLAFDFAMGNALAMGSTDEPVDLKEGVAPLRPRQTEMYAASMGGKLKHAGTQWRTSYRWQPAATFTRVDSFATGLPDPYLSFYLRQPIRYRHIFPNGMEALVDVRNLLAQGYRPFVTSDGSTLYFAQAERSVEAGLSFTF